LVGGESIKVKVSIKIGTSQHRDPGYGFFDIVQNIFLFIIPLKFGILSNHPLQGFDNFDEVGSEFPHNIDLPKKGLHSFVVMG
jgi:hypothetical protein